MSTLELFLLGAKVYYQEANLYFQEANDRLGLGFYHRDLGDIALNQNKFALAKEHFTAFLEQAQTIPHNWASAFAKNGLGCAAMGLGDLNFDTMKIGQKLV